MSYPAPDYLEDDPWFGPAYRSVKAQRKYEAAMALKAKKEESKVSGPMMSTRTPKEAPNIHEQMYKVATQSQSTTIHLDPLPVFGGGSENVWQSGTGMTLTS